MSGRSDRKTLNDGDRLRAHLQRENRRSLPVPPGAKDRAVNYLDQTLQTRIARKKALDTRPKSEQALDRYLDEIPEIVRTRANRTIDPKGSISRWCLERRNVDIYKGWLEAEDQTAYLGNAADRFGLPTKVIERIIVDVANLRHIPTDFISEIKVLRELKAAQIYNSFQQTRDKIQAEIDELEDSADDWVPMSTKQSDKGTETVSVSAKSRILELRRLYDMTFKHEREAVDLYIPKASEDSDESAEFLLKIKAGKEFAQAFAETMNRTKEVKVDDRTI